MNRQLELDPSLNWYWLAVGFGGLLMTFWLWCSGTALLEDFDL